MQTELRRQESQHSPSGDAVAFFIKRRAVDPYAQSFIYYGKQAAADAGLGGKSHLHSKLAGAVIHTTGKHNGLHNSDC